MKNIDAQKTIGQNIRHLRLKRRMIQWQVAEILCLVSSLSGCMRSRRINSVSIATLKPN